jgi:3-phosphoshikimate 1-carboxyvinyltransferase
MPGDKSVSHRAGLMAAIAEGETKIANFSAAEDCATTLKCLAELGVVVRRDNSGVYIRGIGLKGLRAPSVEIDCGNSGTTMRLITGILAGQSFDSVLTGDESLVKRPMRRIIEPLQLMGANIESDAGRAPLRIKAVPHLTGTEQTLQVASAQVKSCLLLAGLYAEGTTTIIEPIPTRDHTERMMRWLGVDVSETTVANGKAISVNGGAKLRAADIEVPGDISSAAFFMVAAICLSDSELVIEGVGLNPTRTAIIDVLRNLGADIETSAERTISGEPVGTITVRSGVRPPDGVDRSVISGKTIANLIDEIPVLAILGTQLPGGLEVRDARELRVKETDRIAAVTEDLRRMGARLTEYDDGFYVERSRLDGAVVDSFGDHRIAMAFAVAGLLARGETEIIGADCANISFPGFYETLSTVVS